MPQAAVYRAVFGKGEAFDLDLDVLARGDGALVLVQHHRLDLPQPCVRRRRSRAAGRIVSATDRREPVRRAA